MSGATRCALALALCGAAAVALGAPLGADEMNVLRERDTRYAFVTPSPPALELARTIGRKRARASRSGCRHGRLAGCGEVPR
jgi:hypothetical protein